MSDSEINLQPLGGLQAVGGAQPTTPTPPAPTPAATGMPTTAAPMAPASRSTPYVSSVRHEEEEEKPSRVPLYIGLGVIVIAGACIGRLFLPSSPVDTPPGFATFAAADKSFGCELPQTWHIAAQGNASKEKETSIEDGVIATQSDATVDVSVSSIAGLMKGQLYFGNDPIPSGTFGSRAAPIYRMHGKAFKKTFKNYKETPVVPTLAMYPKMTGLVQDENGKEQIPDIKWSEFTADSNQWGLGGKRHGYRMAVGGNDYIVHVVCECSERDWKKLQPAFVHTIASVQELAPKKVKGIGLPGGGTMPTNGDMPGLGMPGM